MINTPLSLVTGFLQTLDGFCDLDAQGLRAVAAECPVKSFAPEEYLMRKGEAGDVMYILMDGQVRVPVTDTTGEILSTLLLGPREVVGEMALLTDEPRRADVIAYTAVSALAMEKKQMDHLLHRYPSWANFLTSILVKRIQSVNGFQKIGKYQLLNELGTGSTARVYDGIHQYLGRPVAIKMLNHALVYNDLFRERFETEARIIAGLSHPNIIQVYDTEQMHGTFFIIMEKLPGNDLKKMLKRVKKFPPEEVILILHQVARALEYAHQQGILHRDVKLANCIMTESGQVKLMDFGLSQPRGVSETTHIEGSPEYLAPEIIRGAPPDERSDIYALGIMAFALLTGRSPFYAKSVREVLVNHLNKPVPDIAALVPGIPKKLLTFIQGTLTKDPGQRLAHWPTIFSLLERRGTRKSADQTIPTSPAYHSLVLTCPTASSPLLLDALQQLATRINGLTWSDASQPGAEPDRDSSIKTV
ncbi:MAG: protein kinase [Magnetococcales bacterium]|nr:protein kinase [Magnetococcales bacterium]